MKERDRVLNVSRTTYIILHKLNHWETSVSVN